MRSLRPLLSTNLGACTVRAALRAPEGQTAMKNFASWRLRGVLKTKICEALFLETKNGQSIQTIE